MTSGTAPYRTRVVIALAAVGAALAGAGCAPSPPARLVSIVDDGRSAVYFDPTRLEVQAGTQVRWRNASSRVQSVVMDESEVPAGAQPWESGALRAGETVSLRIDVPGTYVYRGGSDDTGLVGTIEVFE